MSPQYHDITTPFIRHAAAILCDTPTPLTGTEIVKWSVFVMSDGDLLPHTGYYPDSPPAMTVLIDNLLALPPSGQFTLLQRLCQLKRFEHQANIQTLRLLLQRWYSAI